jgi:hypothetical protein
MSFVYLYCLLPAVIQANLDGVTAMEDGRPPRSVEAGALQAIVSDVGEDFAEGSLNARIRDLEWLSPRAVRHHDLIDQLYQRCPELLPLAFGAIFTSEESLSERLIAQQTALSQQLAELRGKEEWNVRLTRDEAEFRAQLRSHSPGLQELEAELAGKAPGTRFLLEKKIRNMEAREAQRVSGEVRDDVHASLSRLAVQSRREQLAQTTETGGLRLELRSAYLIEEAAGDDLKNAVSALSGKHALLGYRFELTGPWPAFSFAGGVREALG